VLARPDLEVALVAGHEVPGIGRELMADGVDQSGWPVKIESLLPAKAVPEQPVEACEMIHVHVADEHVAHTQQFARWQRAQVAEIEQERAPLEDELDIQARVAEGVINEVCVETRRHSVLDGRDEPSAWAQFSPIG
jgi:hypothetical protein